MNFGALKSNMPGDSWLRLVDGTTTGYTVLKDGFEFSVPQFESLYAGSIDRQGSRMIGARTLSRNVSLPLLIEGATQTSLQSKMQALYQMVERLRLYGGTFRFKATNLTYYATVRVIDATLSGDVISKDSEAYNRAFITITLNCDPFVLPDSTYIFDGFDTDTYAGNEGKYNEGGADWTIYDTTHYPTISGGILTTPTTAGRTTLRHTGTGHKYQNLEMRAKVRFSANVASSYIALVLKDRGTTPGLGHLRVYASSDGATGGAINVQGVKDTGATSTTATTITTLTAGTWYWIVGRIEGNVVTAEWWATKPTPNGSPVHSATRTMNSTEALLFGKGVSSNISLQWSTGGSMYFDVDDFEVVANTFDAFNAPEVLPVAAVPGDVPALVDWFSTGAPSAGTDPVWAMVSWNQRGKKFNYIGNGGFETNTTGWVATAVAGVISAATSITRVTTQSYKGVASGQLVTPATTDTGCSFFIGARFKKGNRYIATLRARASASTTACRIKLGISGNLATSTARALTTTWEQYKIEWIPSADTNNAYVAFGVNAATATTCEIDEVQVYEISDIAKVYTDTEDLDPVFYARLGESSGNVTDVIGSRTGTVSGNPTYGWLGPIPGDATTCIDLDGTGDLINFSYDATLNPEKFTLEAWVMRDVDSGAAEYVIDCCANNKGFRMGISATDTLFLAVGDGAAISTAAQSINTMSTALWYHCVLTYDGTTGRVYLNGQYESGGADAYSVNTTAVMRIGALIAGTNLMSGKVSNVRVYNRVLTAEEILRRYAGEQPNFGGAGAYPPFGIIEAEAASTVGAYWAVTNDTAMRGDYKLYGTGATSSTNCYGEWYIDPSLLVPDAYSDTEVMVEVWARMKIASTQTAVQVAASVYPEYSTDFGQARFTNEYGSTGKTLTGYSSNSDIYHLGTIPLSVLSNMKRWILKVHAINGGGSTGELSLDYVMLTRSRARASSITGVDDDTGYSDFGDSGSYQRVSSDLRKYTSDPAGLVGLSYGEYPSGSIGGSQLMFPTGEVEVLVAMYDVPPDHPTATIGSTESTTVTTSFVVQPRLYGNRSNT